MNGNHTVHPERKFKSSLFPPLSPSPQCLSWHPDHCVVRLSLSLSFSSCSAIDNT